MNASVFAREEVVDVVALDIGGDPLAVAPEMIGELPVRVTMIEEAERVIEALPIGLTGGAGRARVPTCR